MATDYEEIPVKQITLTVEGEIAGDVTFDPEDYIVRVVSRSDEYNNVFGATIVAADEH